MSLAAPPSDQLADILPDTVGGGATGWTIKVGQMVSEPDQLIVFYDSGGQNPNPRWRLDFLMVMVQVRGAPNDYRTAWQKARQVRDYYLGIFSQTLESGDRVDSIICMGDLAFVSYDDQKRPLFSINFRVIWEPADTNLTSREPL